VQLLDEEHLAALDRYPHALHPLHPGMCQDDSTLMERIRARDETGAARVRHRKMDDAVAYMTTQLNIAGPARRYQYPGVVPL